MKGGLRGGWSCWAIGPKFGRACLRFFFWNASCLWIHITYIILEFANWGAYNPKSILKLARFGPQLAPLATFMPQWSRGWGDRAKIGLLACFD
jgi:hypothetical protein